MEIGSMVTLVNRAALLELEFRRAAVEWRLPPKVYEERLALLKEHHRRLLLEAKPMTKAGGLPTAALLEILNRLAAARAAAERYLNELQERRQ